MFNALDQLDYTLRLSLVPGTKLSEASRAFSIKSEVGMYVDGDSTEINLFFPDSAEQSRELRMFLQEFDAVEKNGLWRVKRPIRESLAFFRTVKSILEVPSAVLVGSWLSDGVHRMEFIFHGSDALKVSDILLRQLPDAGNASIEYFGRSEGLRNILSSIDARTPISVMDLELTPPEDELTPIRNPVGDSWTRMLKISSGSQYIQAVYFTSRRPRESKGITTIVDGEIYEAATENAYVSYINRKMNTERIFSLIRFHEFNKPSFSGYMILPTFFVNEFLHIVASSAGDMKEWRPVIKSLVSYREWMSSLEEVEK